MKESGREGERGQKQEGKETSRGLTLKTETNAVFHVFPSPSTFPHFYASNANIANHYSALSQQSVQ